jgi:hypothetical protein
MLSINHSVTQGNQRYGQQWIAWTLFDKFIEMWQYHYYNDNGDK